MSQTGNLWKSMQGRAAIVVCNKSDLPAFRQHHFEDVKVLPISAVTGAGVDDLLASIRAKVEEQTRVHEDDSIISTVRHRDLLRVAVDSVDRSLVAAQNGLSEEFVVADLQAALQSVGEITGEVTVEEIYTHIFSNFCIGK